MSIFLLVLCWVARIVGTVFVLFILISIGSDIFDSLHKQVSIGIPIHVTGLLILRTALLFASLAGLVIAFWREGLGGLISLVSMLSLLIPLIHQPVSRSLLNIFLLVIPSLLYLLYWLLARNAEGKNDL